MRLWNQPGKISSPGGGEGATDIETGGLTLRVAEPRDTDECGHICYEAFREIAERHGFPPDFPAPEIAVGVVGMLIGHPGFYGVVAEQDGRIVGSNFLDERSTIAGVGPITVDPAVQNARAGRALMLDVMSRADERNFPGVRLLQAAYHARSLSLYAKLGFEVRESCVTMQGAPVGETVHGRTVRSATLVDVDACNRICAAVHGHDRGGEVRDAVELGNARVVERDGEITGYTTGIAFFAHTVGESNDDLKALIGAASEFGGPGFLVPARNGELYRWCMSRGLRVVHVMNLMTVGLYNEPAGVYLPSVLY